MYLAAPDWLIMERQDFCCFPTWAYLASKTKFMVEWQKIACMNESCKNFRSWIVWMGLFFLEMTLFCRLYYWSIAREEFIRVSHTWELSGESNARKFLNFLNFYPKKPHKWWRFSIFVSAIMICPPHEILLGQDICQLAVAFCLAVSIIVLACLTEQRVHVFFA